MSPRQLFPLSPTWRDARNVFNEVKTESWSFVLVHPGINLC